MSSFSENLLVNHLHKCRCCFKLLKDAEKKLKINKKIESKFHALTQIELRVSELYSPYICDLCKNDLDGFYDLKKDLIEKQSKLYELIEKNVELDEVFIKQEPKDEPDVIDYDPGMQPIIKSEATVLVEKTEPIDFPSYNFEDDYKWEDTQEDPTDDFSTPVPAKKKKKAKSKKPTREKRKCPHCDRFFLESHTLDLHVQFYHFGIKPFQCDKCDYKTHIKYAIKGHQLRMHGEGIPSQKEQCPQCGKFVCSLVHHIKQIHTKEKSLLCDLCGFGTFAKHYLKRHMHWRHVPKEMKQRFSCPICKKRLIGKQTVRSHIQNVHETVGRNFLCHCGKSFKCKLYLYNHQRITHEGKKKHQCKYCQKEFINISQFKEHVYKHENNNSKDWTCDMCGKVYGSESLMLRHQIFHRDPTFLCAYEGCGKLFHKRCILKRHVRFNHEQEFTNCKHCGKELNIWAVPRHVKEFHSGISKTECLVQGCTSSFLRRTHMRGHINRMHKDFLSTLDADTKEKLFKDVKDLKTI